MNELLDLFLNHTAVTQLNELPMMFVDPTAPVHYRLMNGTIEAYCLTPSTASDAPEGSFFFVFIREIEKVPALWRGPMGNTATEFHTGLRAMCFMGATRRLPCDIRLASSLCLLAARGDVDSIRWLFRLGLDQGLLDSLHQYLAPSTRRLETYGIPYAASSLSPRSKRG